MRRISSPTSATSEYGRFGWPRWIGASLVWFSLGANAIESGSAPEVDVGPCARVAEAQNCWARYQASGVDPGFARVREKLYAALDEDDEARGRRHLALSQLAFLDSDFATVEQHARAAVAGCLRHRHIACEMQARRFLSFALDQLQRLPEAIWEVEKAFELARELGLPADQFKAASTLARHRIVSLNDLPRAAEVLEMSLAIAPQMPLIDQLYFQHARVRIRQRLGYMAQAAVLSRQLQSLALQVGDKPVYLAAGINRIWQLHAAGPFTDWQRRRQLRALDQLLADDDISAIQQMSGLELKAALSDPETARRHLLDCVAAAQAAEQLDWLAACAARLSRLLAQVNPDRAKDWLSRAKSAAEGLSNPQVAKAIAGAELALLWQKAATKEHVDRSIALLAAVRDLRARQRTSDRAAEFLSLLNRDDYWVADRIVEAVQRGQLSTDALAAAVAIVESARATASAARISPHPQAPMLADWLAARRALLQTPGDGPEYQERFSKLEAAPGRSRAEVPSADRFTAGQINRMADRSEPLVYFQWPSDPTLSRRAYVLHRKEIQVVELDKERRFDALLEAFEAAARDRRPRQLERYLAQLFQQLAAPILVLLPAADRQLTLVPDGSLYALPFAAMGSIEPRLGQSMIFPSLKSLDTAEPSEPRKLAVFADPPAPRHPLPAGGSAPPLQPLPGAVAEARAVANLVGAASTVNTADQASERLALQALSQRGAIVHFASHAVLNEYDPLSSSLQLGSDELSDGWLTLAELKHHRVSADLVVLSACEAAGGRRLTGEGLVGFSQILLESGAGAVLANLWPLDDQHAAISMTRLYAYLMQGYSLRQAQQYTMTDLRSAGYPATAWAGWALMGNGNLHLHRQQWWYANWIAAGGGSLVLVLMLIALWRSKRQP